MFVLLCVCIALYYAQSSLALRSRLCLLRKASFDVVNVVHRGVLAHSLNLNRGTPTIPATTSTATHNTQQYQPLSTTHNNINHCQQHTTISTTVHNTQQYQPPTTLTTISVITTTPHHEQKIDGCNKMTCTKCNAYFCWLCGHVLDKGNPYSHYGDKSGKCYNKLFLGLTRGGDGDEEEEDDDNEFVFLLDGDEGA